MNKIQFVDVYLVIFFREKLPVNWKDWDNNDQKKCLSTSLWVIQISPCDPVTSRCVRISLIKKASDIDKVVARRRLNSQEHSTILYCWNQIQFFVVVVSTQFISINVMWDAVKLINENHKFELTGRMNEWKWKNVLDISIVILR